MPNPNSQSVVDIAIQYREALARRDVQALNRLIKAYGGIYGRLTSDIEALALEIAQNEITTKTQLYRMDRYKRLLRQTADELQKYQALTGAEVDAAARLGVELGEAHARGLTAAALTGSNNTRIAAVFHRLPTEAITQLLGFLDPDGPLYERIGQMSAVTTDRVANAFVEAVAKGYNPRKTAGILQKQYGMTLTESLRMTRTAQLYSYREANRASYLANSDILSGWQWHAKLDGLTCMSCVAQHGSIHPLTETLNDHYNGRCAPLPVTRTFGPHIEEGAGREWFEGLSEAEQRKMMGANMQKEFSQMSARRRPRYWENISVTQHDPVYGPMKTQGTWKDVFGASFRELNPPKQPTGPIGSQSFTPSGTLVSDALKGPKSSKYGKRYGLSNDLINSVHGDGDLPEIPVKTKSNMSEYGHLQISYRGEPMEIAINGKGDHLELTYCHEVGHFLDYFGMPEAGGKYAASEGANSLAGGALREWTQAIEQSESYKTLLDMRRNPSKYEIENTWVSRFTGEEHKYTQAPDARHLRYLLTPRETWARSYAQYITKKSGNEILSEQLSKELSDKMYGARHWSDEDFAPIEAAIDKIFLSLGWIK